MDLVNGQGPSNDNIHGTSVGTRSAGTSMFDASVLYQDEVEAPPTQQITNLNASYHSLHLQGINTLAPLHQYIVNPALAQRIPPTYPPTEENGFFGVGLQMDQHPTVTPGPYGYDRYTPQSGTYITEPGSLAPQLQQPLTAHPHGPYYLQQDRSGTPYKTSQDNTRRDAEYYPQLAQDWQNIGASR